MTPGLSRDRNHRQMLRYSCSLAIALVLGVLLPTAASAEPTEPPLKSTSTTLTCSPSPVVVFNTTFCTAVVKDLSLKPITPGDFVTFKTSGPGKFAPEICTLNAEGNGVASCRVPFSSNAVGTETITATYEGDDFHTGSQGTAKLPVASPPPPPLKSTSTTLTCTPSTLNVGSVSTCTAVVRDLSPNPSFVTGQAGFKSSLGGKFSATTCKLSIVGVGMSSCQVSYSPTLAGTQTITAFYSGDSSHETSQGSTKVVSL